jgi:hypothetical protein
MENNKQNLTKPLPAWYFEAFALRVRGLTYKSIAERLKKNESYVRQLFMKTGPLYEYYRDYVTNHKQEEVEQALDMMFGHLTDVVRLDIIAAQNTKSMVGHLARETIKAHTLGKPEERLKLEGGLVVASFAEWAAQQAKEIKEYEESRKSSTIITEISEESD